MDIHNLSWDEETELYSKLCNLFERNYQEMPEPGSPEDDGTFHTSDEARRASTAVMRLFGVRERSPEELVEIMGPDMIKGILAYREKYNVR